MGVLKIMSVGKSGVGKSTIGNCLLNDDPKIKSFRTSTGADSCTQASEWISLKDVSYCDVPGIPDTNPRNTKQLYDMIIEEARKELNVILFVFTYEKIDVAAYSKAKMFFRELKKSEAIKILVINDMKNYTFTKRASPEDYETQAKSIKEGTGMSFSHVISMTADTMVDSMKNLKELLSKTKAYESPNLKTYVELQAYVKELETKQNHEQVAYEEGLAKITRLENTLNALEATAAGLAVAATAASVASFFTFGATLGIATPTACAAASAIVAIEVNRRELQTARDNMSKDKIDEATRLLKEACESFKELNAAMELDY